MEEEEEERGAAAGEEGARWVLRNVLEVHWVQVESAICEAVE